MHAATTRDQQSLARSLGPHEREPEQAGGEIDRNRNAPRGHFGEWDATEAAGAGGDGHGAYKPDFAPNAP